MSAPKNFVFVPGFNFGQLFKTAVGNPETWVMYDYRIGATFAVDAASPEGIEYQALMNNAQPFSQELIDKLNASSTAIAFWPLDLVSAVAA